MNEKFYEELKQILAEDYIKLKEPMKNHTTFRIGGEADYFVTPQTKEEVQAVAACCKKFEVPYYIIGNGSNLLVSDRGYRGVIIQIFKMMNQIIVEDNLIIAQAGALLSAIAAKARVFDTCILKIL